MTRLGITGLYLTFAGIATCANIATQWFIFRVLPAHYQLYGSMLAGTAVGLAVKYMLDKRWIFGFRADSQTHEVCTFFRYSTTGILTTLMFWGTELVFQYVFGLEIMRYIGAALGLAVGYLIKYNLDKRLVFIRVSHL